MLEYSDSQKSEKLFFIYNKLPRILKILCIKSLCSLNTALLQRLRTPTVITFYVTYKCFASCKHCFLVDQLNKNLTADLRISEIKKIFTSLKHRLTRVAFGGGESFLREDIAEIYKLIYEINKPNKFWVATPGLYPQRIEKAVGEILSNIKNTPYVLSISLEGLEEVHDNTIGIQGAFVKALETIERLKKIKTQHPNFDLRILTTISNANLKCINEFIEFVKKELKLTHLFSFIWGSDLTCFSARSDLINPLNPSDTTLIPPLGKIQYINDILEEKTGDKSLLSRIEFLKRKFVIDILKNKKRLVSCIAPKINATIYPDGKVSFCEFTRPFGNLRDFDLDFLKLWHSDKTQFARSQLTECACTLPYILAMSLFYSEKALLELL